LNDLLVYQPTTARYLMKKQARESLLHSSCPLISEFHTKITWE